VSTLGPEQPASLRHNDWAPLNPPQLDGWTPDLPVTVIVVGGSAAAPPERTMVALRHQTYPAELLHLVTAAGTTFAAEATAAKGDIVIRIPAGAIPAPDFVAALARWQHTSPDAVSLALPRFVTGGVPSTEEITHHSAAGSLDRLLPAGQPDPARTAALTAAHHLRTADHLGFLALDATPFAFHRDRYQPGTDPYQGADIEVGYRLAQAGAVFVPEPRARVWLPVPDNSAIGPDSSETGPDSSETGPDNSVGHPDGRWRAPELTDLMPYPRENRRAVGRTWQVPLLVAVVRADEPYETVRTCVDRLLGGDEHDLRVLLVGDWQVAGAHQGPDLPLIAAEYRSEPRVSLVDRTPGTAFPSPYLLRVPARLGVGPTTLSQLVAVAERWRCGLVRVLPAGASSAAYALELWSTAARSRAQHAGVPEADLPTAVADSHGQRWETGSEYGVVDLAAGGAPAPTGQSAPADGEQKAIPVGGARSLAKAVVFVTRRYAQAARRRLVRR